MELVKLLKNTMHYPENCKIEEYRGFWTKKELAEKISEIFDLERILSEKTIENDLKKMELDYNAPIKKNILRYRALFTEKNQQLIKL